MNLTTNRSEKRTLILLRAEGGEVRRWALSLGQGQFPTTWAGVHSGHREWCVGPGCSWGCWAELLMLWAWPGHVVSRWVIVESIHIVSKCWALLVLGSVSWGVLRAPRIPLSLRLISKLTLCWGFFCPRLVPVTFGVCSSLCPWEGCRSRRAGGFICN